MKWSHAYTIVSLWQVFALIATGLFVIHCPGNLSRITIVIFAYMAGMMATQATVIFLDFNGSILDKKSQPPEEKPHDPTP